jgi:hypothetical protein
MKIKLQKVAYMPKQLEAGVLYVAEEFGAAAHLCPCGCGSKVRTPLGPTEWRLEETPNGPTLDPSVGNWQLACKSHYWIQDGEINWAEKWTPRQIKRGRAFEQARRERYYDSTTHNRSRARRMLDKLMRIFKR